MVNSREAAGLRAGTRRVDQQRPPPEGVQAGKLGTPAGLAVAEQARPQQRHGAVGGTGVLDVERPRVVGTLSAAGRARHR